jgi:hypothetical protein
MLEDLRRLAPDLDTRRWTFTRTLVEGAATEATRIATEVLTRVEEQTLPDLSRSLPSLAAVDYAALETRVLANLGLGMDLPPGWIDPPPRGTTRTGLVLDAVRRIYEQQQPVSREWVEQVILRQAGPNANGDLYPETIQPLTRADLQRTRDELAAMSFSPGIQPFYDVQTHRDIVQPGGYYIDSQNTSGLASRPNLPSDHTDPYAWAREQIMAHEDRLIFEALDQASRDEGTWAQEYMGVPTPMDQGQIASATGHAHAHGWMMHELPGRMEINPRAIERVMGGMPIESMPRVTLDEIRNRRFDMTPRMPRHDSTNPCGEIPLGPSSYMDLAEMKKVALIVRRTAWQHVLAVEELEF